MLFFLEGFSIFGSEKRGNEKVPSASHSPKDLQLHCLLRITSNLIVQQAVEFS